MARHQGPPSWLLGHIDGTSRIHSSIVSAHPVDNGTAECLELPVEELLRRNRPLPDHDEMVIEGLTVEEGEAFLAAIES